MKEFVLLLFIFMVCHSCDEDSDVDCSVVLCAGPATLAFEVLENGQNVFDTGATIDDIIISGNFPESYEFQVEESNYNGGTPLLFVQQIDWEVRTYDFNLVVDSEQGPELAVTISLSTGDCCGGIAEISQFEVNGTILENPNQVVTIELE